MSPWQTLIAAGALEVVWASALKASDGFTRPGPTALTVIAAAASFWLLAIALRALPAGTAYAVWTGIGAVGVAIVGAVLFAEAVTLMRVVGIALILAGIAALKMG